MSRGRWRTLRMFAPMIGRVPMGHLWYLWRQMRFEKPHRFGDQIRINTFFPPWPSPAFDRFCAAVIARRRMPYSVYVAATAECPYACGHCSYKGRATSAGGLAPERSEVPVPGASRPPADAREAHADLPRDAMLDLIAQIKTLGTCTVGFTGGEPLLRDDLDDLVAATGPEMASVVFTTGVGLDAARAQRLAAAGVTCVTIGVESSDPAAHDRVRGVDGSFAEAEAAAAACREAGIYLAVSTVAFREKIASGELDRMYDLAAAWGAGELRVLTPIATGGIAGCGAAMLTDAERRAVIEFHKRRNREPSGPAVASFAHLESDALFGCGAGYHHLFIDAAGEVCPCDLTPLSFGSVVAEPLAAIYQRMGRLFDLPRRGCLMARLAGRIDPSTPLPLPPAQSEKLVPPRPPDEPLPEAVRRLMK